MYFTLGTYTTPNNSSWATLSIQAVVSDIGRKVSEKQVWNLHTTLQADTQAGLTTLIDAHEEGVRQNNVDLTFYQDDGTETAHKIVSASTRNGIEFRGLTYPGYFPGVWGQKTEYAYLRYAVSTHAAEVFDVENNILFLRQSMRYSVGGLDYAVLGALTGPPALQFTMQQAPFWGIQKGYAVGMFSNPEPVGAIVNAFPSPRHSWIQKDSPMNYGRVQHYGFPTSWYYHYESPGPLNATPPTIV